MPGDGSFYNARFYTVGYNCAGVAQAAMKHTKSAEGYIGIGNKTCFKINSLWRREGAAF